MLRCVQFLCVFYLYNIFTNGEHYELLEDDFEISATQIALLVEDSPRNFQNVLNFIQTVPTDNRDLWLITFNSSGVSSVWEKSFNNVDGFYKKIHFLASQSNSESDLSINESLPLFALFNTAKILPKKGAIVIFTGSFMNMDTHLEKVALNVVLSKNITVYTISDNDHKTPDLLKKIREYSGGRILRIKGTTHEDSKRSTYAVPKNVSVILSRKKLQNTTELSFPIDHDVTGIHITIWPSTNTMGLLISPNGYQFSFSNQAKSDAIRYSQGSVFENHNGIYDLHLNFSTSIRVTIGLWQLKLENPKEFYNVTIFAFTNIAVNARIHFARKGVNTDDNPKEVLKLGVTGNISHLTDISVLNRNGETVLSNVSYKFNNERLKYVTENGDNTPDIENKEVNVEINKLRRTQPFYALIRGKDVKGNAFQRLSYIYPKSDIYPQQTLTVEVGLGSELILSSGRKAEVYIEVTNLATNAQFVSFTCSDSKYILQSLSIYRKYLEPQESTIATLYLNPNTGTYQDEITFSVTSGSQVFQKKIIVDVGLLIADQTEPEISHKYSSDCTGVIFAQCSKGTWTVEITARDIDSGLLQLNTVPKGIFFPYGYTSGTKDSVTGYYSDSCCNPDLQISAVDRLNNRRSYKINAYHAIWSPGAIAALVLGILLLIILLCVIAYFVAKKIKTKESYDLPTYRGGGI